MQSVEPAQTATPLLSRLTRRLRSLFVACLALPVALFAQPLFDAHLHYDAADARRYPPERILEILQRNEVAQALVTGTPPRHVRALYREAPQRILPFLSVYRERADKANWHQDADLPAYVIHQLDTGPWQGIGELHLFAEHRHSPVFERIVQIAVQHELPLLMHADPAVIDTLFERAPAATVLWAHAGTFPYPELIADYLSRYPNLYVDLSMRDGHIAPDGVLRDDWWELLLAHPGRFLIGVDTFSTRRWQHFGEASSRIRQWLEQLPPEVAARIARKNAETLLRRPPAGAQQDAAPVHGPAHGRR